MSRPKEVLSRIEKLKQCFLNGEFTGERLKHLESILRKILDEDTPGTRPPALADDIRRYFSNEGKDEYVCIIGANRTSSKEKVIEIAVAEGFPENNIKTFFDFERFRSESVYPLLKNPNCIAAITGAMPHKIRDRSEVDVRLGEIIRINALSESHPPKPKITKTSLEASLQKLRSRILNGRAP